MGTEGKPGPNPEDFMTEEDKKQIIEIDRRLEEAEKRSIPTQQKVYDWEKEGDFTE